MNLRGLHDVELSEMQSLMDSDLKKLNERRLAVQREMVRRARLLDRIVVIPESLVNVR